jgi:hypothetical protein
MVPLPHTNGTFNTTPNTATNNTKTQTPETKPALILPKTFSLPNDDITCKQFIILVEESSIGLTDHEISDGSGEGRDKVQGIVSSFKKPECGWIA